MAWSDRLEELQRQGTLTGFALLTAQGICKPATGPFAAAPEDAGRLATPFYSPQPALAVHDLAGTRLVVVNQEPGSFLALSHRRRLCVAARHLPCGVLLASFSWPTPPQAVACELDRCCAALQA